MRFEKVSFEQYWKDLHDEVFIKFGEEFSPHNLLDDCHYIESVRREYYNDITIPRRATKKSAGYDFFAPYEFTLDSGDTLKLATGIKVTLDDDKWLMCLPRSSHGFKARIQFDNTVGVIDADYYNNIKNEGHIWVKLTNDSRLKKSITVKKGEAFCQGIILQYFITEDDDSTGERIGGLGST